MVSKLRTVGWVLAGTALALTVRSLTRRPRESFAGKTVVISGGSRGLGLEMARLWTAEGARVAICARDGDEIARALRELSTKGGNAWGRVCDVTNAAEVNGFMDAVHQRFNRIDVVVNNAGVIQVGPENCMTASDYENALATHFWGPYHMIQAALPFLRRQRGGRIVNISSIGGRISVPHLLPYCTSKFALVGYSEGLATVLAEEGISVTTVTPGLMRTGSARNAEFKGRHRAEYAMFGIAAALPGITVDSKTAARRIVEACRRRDPALSVSWFSALASRVHGLCPGLTTTALSLAHPHLPTDPDRSPEIRKGWQSESAWAPSWLTLLNDQASVRNNELANGN
ncbi:MAG TPA: SDR family oxidoreductase [Planctomycetaceae bacterium]|nr:SDR family oxidoreductase [Planctomycetaceae bacterium]